MRWRNFPRLDFDVRRAGEASRIAAQCERYQYRRPSDNPLYPVAAAARYDRLRDSFGPSWAVPFLPAFGRAIKKRVVGRLTQRLSKRPSFDAAVEAHRSFFGGRSREPDYVARLNDDGQFGFNRIGGVNPTLIARVRSRAELVERMPGLDDLGFARAIGDDGRSLAQEIEEGRLFLLDYSILARALETSDGRCSRWRRTYLPAPVVVLCERPGVLRHCDLVPVAITIDQPGARPPNPMYLRDATNPRGSAGWRIAKYFVEVADHCHHMAVGHLSCAHFIMESVAMSTRRMLLPDHPLRVLLETHTRFTLPVNEVAFRNFIDPSQIYARFYAGELTETAAIARRARSERDFLDLELERDLEARGVSEALREYPYRDDARLFSAPALAFTRAFVETHYESDAAVQTDRQLRAWLGDLVDPEAGNLGRMHPGPVEDRDALAQVLARILFIAGPGHASHHFAEMHYCRFAPMYPGAAWGPPPATPQEATEDYLASLFPPLDVAGEHFMYSDFGDYRFDTFGHYRDRRVLSTPRLREAGLAFERAMREAEQTIERRNAIRSLPYEILLPSKVPNVINF